ncbi:MAG: PCMD domain-containing protein [Bacteroidaceae bacterium]|nr:PCMD domain-containing protein [Bacteroidaceae bacterium]
MKKISIYLFAMLISSACFFTSCSDDDKKPPVYPVDAEIAGIYKGTLDISMDGISLGTGIVKHVTITKASDRSINLELKDFSFLNMDLGTITLSDCALTKDGNSYLFTGQSPLNIPEYSLTGDIDVKGSVTGNIVVVDLDIAAKLGAQQQNVTVSYEGTKLDASASSEAKITSFTFNLEECDFIVEQPVIDEEAGTIRFHVLAGYEDEEGLTEMVPTITISDKATISPEPSVAQDFSNGKSVVYTVTSENGTIKKYTVSTFAFEPKTNFEVWVKASGEQEGVDPFYEVAGWSSSNTGAFMLKMMGLTDRFGITKSSDAHSGNASAKIETLDTQGMDMFIAKVPKVTAGSLFLGQFRTNLGNTLSSTKFGIPFTQKPKSLKGWYKYTPGTDFYVCESVETCHEATVDPDKSDEFAIKAVLYSTDEYKSDLSDCLTGEAGENNIYASDRVVAIASLEGGLQAEWKQFDISFEYSKEYDANKKYRFAIICSSSKEGDKFWGAPGSTLLVDDFELVAE